MSGDDIARLIYLGLLAAAIGGYFFVQNRHDLGRVMQQAAVWALIFLGAIASYGLWNDIRGQVAPIQQILADGTIEAPLGRDGHYHLTLDINETPVKFIVDTGASDIVLSERDARRIGVDPDRLAYLGTAQTANGIVRTARVTLDQVRLGPVIDTRVRAVVNEGDLDGSLLGMSYLSRFERIEIADGRLVLHR